MNKLIEFIENYKKTNPTGWKKWVIGSVILLLVLLISGVVLFQQILRARMLSELQHERDVLEESAKQAATNATLASLKEEREHHQELATQALEAVSHIEEELKTIQEEHNTNRDVLSSLNSWSDVDAHVK